MGRTATSILQPEIAAVILDSVTDGVFTVDQEWRITSFNRAASRITGIPQDVAIGRYCSDVFRTTACESSCILRQTMATGQPIVNRAIFLVNPQGDKIPISVSTALLKDRQGRIIGGVETFRDISVVEELRARLSERRHLGGIITRDPTLADLLELLPRIAESEATILILGESGTGKELLARAVHDLSPRRKHPLVVVNCAALPENLLESELFGYKAGAFTDARRDKPGRFALAEGGTLFFDEIGELPPALQVKLLRVLQERVYEPLGGMRPVSTNVRVISATNRDLPAMVAAGTFRADLFYRINVMTCRIPPLRTRPTDIALLVAHFIKRFNAGRNKPVSGITPAALDLLSSYAFPGNIRELENLIERAFILCLEGPIGPEHLPPEIRMTQALHPHSHHHHHSRPHVPIAGHISGQTPEQIAEHIVEHPGAAAFSSRPASAATPATAAMAAAMAAATATTLSAPTASSLDANAIGFPSPRTSDTPLPELGAADTNQPLDRTTSVIATATEAIAPTEAIAALDRQLSDKAPKTGSFRGLEAQFLRQKLLEHNGNRSATAAALGIHPTTLWRKLKRLGI